MVGRLNFFCEGVGVLFRDKSLRLSDYDFLANWMVGAVMTLGLGLGGAA